MDRLISDIVVRRTAQVVLLAILLALIMLCLGLSWPVYLRATSRLDNPTDAIRAFDFLSRPLKETFSGLAVILATAIPVAFSRVCFTIDKTVNPPTSGSELNRVGHAAFLLTAAGLLVGTGTLLMFTVNSEAVVTLANGADKQAAIQGLINSVVAFNGVYFVQLLGLKPK